MNPIIFLDIYGVLNCQIFYEGQQYKDYKEAKKVLRKSVKADKISRMEYYKSQICTERIKMLNQLCVEIDAKIVVSSIWRMNKTVEALQELFNYCGATFEVIDKTGYTGFERGTEISQWLKANITPETYGCHLRSLAFVADVLCA